MKKILVPLDFSDESINALKTANQISKRGETEIKLSHTIEIPDYFDLPSESDDSYRSELLKAVERKIDELLKDKEISIPKTSIYIEFGHPFSHIQELIESQKIDLIVMGGRGLRNWEGQMIGSNTNKIVRRVQCPVLIVKDSSSIDQIDNIVFATDLSNTPMLVTRALKELQQVLDARLEILKVVTPDNWATEPEIKGQVDKFAELHNLTNYSMRIYNDMDVESGIVHYSRESNAGLVAMASHTKVHLPSLIQDNRTTERVVENCKHLIWTCGLGDRTN
ncbi:MAG: universal stress protein [Cyclobacteriaceae bacterium]